MKLSRKTLYYSIGLGAIILISLFLYLIFLLPNLYVDNMKKNDYYKARTFQEIAMEKGEITKEESPSISASYMVKIPKEGNTIEISSPMLKFYVELKDKELINALTLVRNVDLNDEKWIENEGIKELSKVDFATKIMDAVNTNNPSFNFKFETKGNTTTNPLGSGDTVFYQGKNYVLVGNTVKDHERIYSSYVGMGKKDGEIIVTMLPFAASDIRDIKNVVVDSLPMILLYLFLITTLASLFFSKKIVNPIKKLDAYTSNLTNLNYEEAEPFEIDTKDEIEDLSHRINAMYDDLRKNYKKLEDENKNKELFLRASSHQLKTPIQATLLLLDGMINEIGKFKDRDTYLVEVKKQIISMQKIIEDLLFLNKPINAENNVELDVATMVETVLNEYKVALESKNIKVNKSLKEVTLNTNPILFKKIIDNLISNSISHGVENTNIDIILNTNELMVINDGHIPEEIKDNIFEAFVTTKSHLKSGGLGLFIAEKFSKSLGYNLSCKNLENNRVSFTLDFI